MELLLVRHGETLENVKGIVQGQTAGGALTEKGIRQAEKVAEELRGEKIDIIYSSDLERAKRTAVIISKNHLVPVLFTPLLRERSFGEYEGGPTERIDEWAEKTGKNRYHVEPKGGETIDEFYSRVKGVLAKIAASHHGNEKVVIVTHKGAMRMILAAVKGISPLEAMSIPSENAEVVRVNVSEAVAEKLRGPKKLKA